MSRKNDLILVLASLFAIGFVYALFTDFQQPQAEDSDSVILDPAFPTLAITVPVSEQIELLIPVSGLTPYEKYWVQASVPNF